MFRPLVCYESRGSWLYTKSCSVFGLLYFFTFVQTWGDQNLISNTLDYCFHVSSCSFSGVSGEWADEVRQSWNKLTISEVVADGTHLRNVVLVTLLGLIRIPNITAQAFKRKHTTPVQSLSIYPVLLDHSKYLSNEGTSAPAVIRRDIPWYREETLKQFSVHDTYATRYDRSPFLISRSAATYSWKLMLYQLVCHNGSTLSPALWNSMSCLLRRFREHLHARSENSNRQEQARAALNCRFLHSIPQ